MFHVDALHEIINSHLIKNVRLFFGSQEKLHRRRPPSSTVIINIDGPKVEISFSFHVIMGRIRHIRADVICIKTFSR